jgi:hypothetical protein
MANLSLEQIREIIKKPQNRAKIEIAIKHEHKLKLHCRAIIDVSEFAEPERNFLEWVKSILPADIYDRFATLFQPPFPTNELTESIFSELSKVFEGQNRFFKFEFTNPDYEADFSDYRIEIDDENFWKNEAWEAVQHELNSIVVIDLPETQTTPLPNPYYYLLDINRLYDFRYNRKKDFDYIIIKEGENYLYIDSSSYVRLEGPNPDQLTAFEIPHNLNYTPAKDLWRTKRKKGGIDKKGPVTKSLSELNWLLFFEISKKYLDLYAPYPIYSAYERECTYTNEQGNSCHGGKVQVVNGYIDCPVCTARKHKIGVGTFIEIPAPATTGDADLRNPVQVLPAEINSLNYSKDEVVRLEQEIYFNCVGKGEPNTDQAQNEKQVQSAFESKTNKLTWVKENLEYINKWTLDTLCIFRYGESFINSTLSYGDITYLETTGDLNEDYKQGKDAGKPVFDLSNKRDRIYNTENRNNPDEQQRIEIKKALEPWQSLDFTQIKTLGLDTQFPEKFLLKVNFDEYIQRFEREQANLLVFGSNLDFAVKIDRIKEELLNYVSEEIPKVIPINNLKTA